MPFGSTPGKHQLNHGERARAQRESGRVTVPQMAESQIPPRERKSSLIGHKLRAKRAPDRVLHAPLQQQQVGCTEAVVLIAGERLRAVDVRSTERLLKIERH